MNMALLFKTIGKMSEDVVSYCRLMEINISNLSLADFGNLSLQDILHSDVHLHKISTNRIWPYFFWITFVIGLVGNLLVVFIMWRKKALHLIPNVYLINLALGDILYLLTTIPNTSFWTDYWPLGEGICQFLFHII